MKKETELFIKDLVKKIIDEYDINYPLDIDNAICKMGGKVETDYPLCVKKTEDGFTIIAPDNNNYQKALMLGFLFLHLGFRTNNDIWNNININEKNRYKTDDQFEQIKEFMYDLLMPDEMFREELKKISKYNIIDTEGVTKLSKIFGVSETLIFSKLKKLYILEGVNYEISK